MKIVAPTQRKIISKLVLLNSHIYVLKFVLHICLFYWFIVVIVVIVVVFVVVIVIVVVIVVVVVVGESSTATAPVR